MKVTVLGGSAAAPNAGAGCAGFLVATEQNRVVLDLGPGTLGELRRRADLAAIDAIIVSHLHLDHVLDVFALRYGRGYLPTPPPRPIPVWMPPGGAGWLERAALPFETGEPPGFFRRGVPAYEYDPGAGLRIGDLRLSFSPTVHSAPTWAVRLETDDGRALGYTADTGPSADLAGFFAGVQILVAEATLMVPGDRPFAERGSLTAAEAGALASAAGASTLLLTHLWQEHDLASQCRSAAGAFAGRVEIARPGLEIAW